MAFTNFCCRSGGSNLNAGTRTGDTTEPGTSADLTYASGSWVAGTGVFTVASGDPVADGVAVGDFASVYADASSETGFVGRVTARTTTTITVSLTAKSGTAPTDGTGNRTLKIGGAWAGPSGTNGFPLNFLCGTMTNAAGRVVRLNMKNDQTYSVSATISLGAAVSPSTRIIQGYTSSYGDFGKATITGSHSGDVINFGGNVSTLCDLHVKSTATSGSGHGISTSATPAAIFRCIASGHRGSGFTSVRADTWHIECEAYDCGKANAGHAGFSVPSICIRCVARDNAGTNTTGFYGVAIRCQQCISVRNGSHGFAIAYGSAAVSACTADANGGAGIYVGSTQYNQVSLVENNLLTNNGGYGININNIVDFNAPGCWLTGNAFGAGTEANASGEIGYTDQFSGYLDGSVTLASNESPFVDASAGDYRLISGCLALNAGRGEFTASDPGFSGTVSYPDIGAAQAQSTGGGGGSAKPHHPFSQQVIA